jgi:excinuclease ABC subunit C
MDEFLRDKIKNLPDSPGVYQFFDNNNQIIYVGKAKSLKKRVLSYFNKNLYVNYRLKLLVKKITDIKYIIVESESEALLLENNLIKKYQPKYNVQLKDDKTFPWICIKNEPFPRVFSTRNIVQDGSQYFGPYTSANMVRILLDLIRKLYPLRTCNYNLTDENIRNGKFRPCLEYHIGNCKAPCIGNQSKSEYDASIENIKHILKGNIQEVINYMHELMQRFAKNYNFEEAQVLKEKIEILEKYKSRSTVVSTTINNVDVFSYIDDGKSLLVNYVRVISGRIVQSHTVDIKKQLEESPEEILPIAMVDIREKLKSSSKEIVAPCSVDFPIEGVKIHIPKKGDKKKLLELSQRNLKYYHLEKQRRNEQIKKKFEKKSVLETLQKDLQLDKLPVNIECFDNSNIQGSHPVAACVVFKHGKPRKKEYRHYNIKSVQGPDDFASMEEVVYRRYKRLMHEGEDLPQLIVIDGGKGQLSSAMKSIHRLGLRDEIAIIGIAKKLEEIYFPNDSVPLYLDKNSASLRLIQQLRDEAHRFGISFHRKKRSQDFTKSELQNIPGIGEKTSKDLLQEYKSVERIKQLSEEQLANVVGNKKAKLIYEYFSQQ